MASDFSVPDWLVDRSGADASADPPDPAEAERDSVRRYGRILSTSSAASRALAELDGRFAEDLDFPTAPQRYREALDGIGREHEGAFEDDAVGRGIFRRDFGTLAAHAIQRFQSANAGREVAHWTRTLEDRWDSLAGLARGMDEAGRAAILRQAALEAHRAQGFGLVPDADAAFHSFLARLAPVPEAPAGETMAESGRGPWGSRTADYRRDRDGEPVFRTAEHRASDEPGERMRLLSADSSGDDGAAEQAGASVDAAPATKDGIQAAERIPQKPVARQKPAPSPAESPLSDAERGRMLDRLSPKEGAIADHPNDKLTHYGVTDEALKDYKSRALPEDPMMKKEVKDLTYADARIILDEMIRQYRVDRIEDADLRQHIFDMIVNHSPALGVQIWQRALNESGMLPKGTVMEEDGILGPATRGGINGLNAAQRRMLNDAIVDKRIELYREIVREDPEKKEFEPGWLNRANSFRLPWRGG